MSENVVQPSPTFYDFPFNTSPMRAPEGIIVWPKPALTHDEIKRVIELCDKGPLEPALVERFNPKNGERAQLVYPKQRASTIVGIALSNETDWLFDRLTQIARSINTEFYGFDLTGVEPMQYALYEAEQAGHFDWHCDIGGKGYRRKRKLTMIVQLSDPSAYEGGELMTLQTCQPWLWSKAFGSLVAFPSFTMHRVAPVTKGVRRSLTCWAVGPDFR